MPKSTDLVVKSNDIINASYRLDVNEVRLLHAMIAQVDSEQSLSSNDVFELYVKDFHDLLSDQISTKSIYYAMKSAVDRLFNRFIKVKINETDYEKIRWVSKAGYHPSEGKVSIQFSQSIIQYLSDIKANFTAYEVRHIMQFSSEYSYRFYELLKQYADFGKRTLTIDELREKLDLLDKYPSTGDLKKWVIDVVDKDIKNNSDLHIDKINPIKRGRKIHAYEFIFHFKKPEPKQKIPQADAQPLMPSVHDQIMQQARPGESYQDAKTRILKQQKLTPGQTFSFDVPAFGEKN